MPKFSGIHNPVPSRYHRGSADNSGIRNLLEVRHNIQLTAKQRTSLVATVCQVLAIVVTLYSIWHSGFSTVPKYGTTFSGAMTTSPRRRTPGQTISLIIRIIRTMVCTCGRLRQLVPSCFQIYGTASIRTISHPGLQDTACYRSFH